MCKTRLKMMVEAMTSEQVAETLLEKLVGLPVQNNRLCLDEPPVSHFIDPL